MREKLRAISEHLEKRDVRKAEVLIAKVLRGDLDTQERGQVLVHRARARLLSGRPDDAIDDLRSIQVSQGHMENPATVELLGDSLFARFELAQVGFADRNDTAQAELAYRELIARFPDYENLGWVYYQLGRVLASQDRVDEAVSCFRQALLTASHVAGLTAFCYERLGYVMFYERRDLQRALSFLNRAVDTYPAYENRTWLVQVHLLRSRVLREMRNYDLALKSADEAVSVAMAVSGENKAGLTDALLAVGELLYEMGGREKEVIHRLQQFLQLTRKPLGIDVTWARVHEMLGDAYFRLGQFDSAVVTYEAVLQYNPDHPWEVALYYRLACGYYQQQNYAKAVSAIERMLKAAEDEGEMVNDYRVYDVLGNACFALKQYDKAAEAYDIALRMAPPNAEELEKIKVYRGYAQELI